MRILDVSPRINVPPVHGSAYRIFHLLRHLSERHEVRQYSQPYLHQLVRGRVGGTVWPTPTYCEHRGRNPLDALVADACARTWITQPVLTGASLAVTRPSRLRAWLRWAEIALVEYPWQLPHCRRAAPRKPIVLAAHNVETAARLSNARAAGIEPAASFLLRWVSRAERLAVALADLVLAVSEDDARGFQERYGLPAERLAVVPNGADIRSLAPAEEAERAELRARLGLPSGPVVLYLSGMPKIPDVQGLRWVRRVAAEMPQVTFLIVGGVCPAPAVEGNVIATGVVPDHRPYVRAADASLCPIEFGGGTKLKLLDSLAAGLPTVAFAETVRGTALRAGEHVVVAGKDVAALTRALHELLGDRPRARALGTAGREHVVAHHDWRPIAAGLEARLAELVA
jgi:polysaccharide biosynthesis protein PslH